MKIKERGMDFKLIHKDIDNQDIEKIRKYVNKKHGWYENVRFRGWWKNGDSYIFSDGNEDKKETVVFCMSRRFLKKIINEC